MITNSSAAATLVAAAFRLTDLFVCSFVGVSVAPVPHIAVPAVTSASVGNSTLPATVSLAFGCVDHAAKAFHAQAIY